MDSAHNNQLHPIFQNMLNAFAESLGLHPCDHCGSPHCDGFIYNCPQHPDKVAAREEKAEADAIWNARFAKAQDAGKYGEEL